MPGVACDQGHAVLDDIEVAQPQEVHLEQAEGLDVVVGDLGDDVALVIDPDRQKVSDRSGGNDHAGGVYALVAHKPFERTGRVDDLLCDVVGVVRGGKFGAGLECLLQFDADGTLRHELGDAVHLAVGEAQHPPGVAHDRPRQELAERADARHRIRAVLLGHVPHHGVAAAHGKIRVDVGHALAARIQEPLEQQAVLDRIQVGDAQGIRNERAGCRTTSRTDGDAVVARPANVVPHDQEVTGEAHLLDHIQLEPKPFLCLGTPHSPVATIQPVTAQALQVAGGGLALGHGERGETRIAERQLQPAAALGHLERGGQRLRILRQRKQHLGGGLEVELLGVELEAFRVRQHITSLDRQERLVGVSVLVADVVDVAGGDQRAAGVLGELCQVYVDALLLLDSGVLEFQVDVLGTKDLAERVEFLAGGAQVVVLEV